MAAIHDRDQVVTHFDRYRASALRLRQEYVGGLFAAASSRGKLSMFAAAFALATAAFWVTMLTSPPVTEATPVEATTK